MGKNQVMLMSLYFYESNQIIEKVPFKVLKEYPKTFLLEADWLINKKELNTITKNGNEGFKICTICDNDKETIKSTRQLLKLKIVAELNHRIENIKVFK